MWKSARQVTFEALLRIEKDASYSNITLDTIFSETELSQKDKNFAAMLFYGVIEKKLLLDYNLSQHFDKNLYQLETELLIILRMGAYQLFFMDSVPDAAAVNESVILCKVNQLAEGSGLVNAVLRNIARHCTLQLPNPKKGRNKYLSVKYSCPESIISLWRKSYGEEITEGLLQSLDGRPPLSARVNSLKITQAELIDSLEHNQIKAKASDLLKNCIHLENTGSVTQLKQFQEGLFHIQDTASQICCSMLEVSEQMTVIDACAAPGGKSFTLAQKMKNTGQILSCDLYPARLKLIESGAVRLGITNLHTQVCDSGEYRGFPMADRVLCDVPCSGLGIIRRKPELRYKNHLGLDTLPNLQYFILCNCSDFVKKDGILIYSTCTLNPEENHRNVERFLKEHQDFQPYPLKMDKALQRGIDEPDYCLTLFPHLNHTDGFFISAFQRK